MRDAITIFERTKDAAGLERSYRYLARRDLNDEQRDAAIEHYRMALRRADPVTICRGGVAGATRIGSDALISCPAPSRRELSLRTPQLAARVAGIHRAQTVG
jgi:hypothetical protein